LPGWIIASTTPSGRRVERNSASSKNVLSGISALSPKRYASTVRPTIRPSCSSTSTGSGWMVAPAQRWTDAGACRPGAGGLRAGGAAVAGAGTGLLAAGERLLCVAVGGAGVVAAGAGSS